MVWDFAEPWRSEKRSIKESRCNQELIREDLDRHLKFWSPGLGIGHSSSVVRGRNIQSEDLGVHVERQMAMRLKDLNRHKKRHRYPEIEKERKLYRLLFILQRGRRAMHVRDLSNEFGVSERSIERDLMVLEGAGFALEQLGRGTYRFIDDNLIPARR